MVENYYHGVGLLRQQFCGTKGEDKGTQPGGHQSGPI